MYPFTSIVGQDELKTALLLCAVDPLIGGVLALGDRGTGKTTTVRALGELLDDPVVDCPLGVTEDRLIGSMDIDHALATGETKLRPGLLADAHGGFLYIDEINLLDDHLVDVLLDVAASGVNIVEREGISHTHPARFVLVGSGNPEEGELRPQLQDRFGLATWVHTLTDPTLRLRIVRDRLAFDADPEGFVAAARPAQDTLQADIARARQELPQVALDDAALVQIIELCAAAGTVGHRGELVVTRAATAHAALRGATEVTTEDIRAVARLALRHRVATEPFETPADVEERLGELLG
ncbi:ATP-binding protein [Corynebacterium hindlerae]|uniref:ATP-binding protein n=1 Tax=Corynebacterium hindlerae TaxID=699041 RepID=UPI001AD60D49|nr:AAA family ATPase [Corynebacterium hindlerae]QTH59904.1 ATP-binding protein [Corynebacterium hindlerae]